jgi:hypothetical protein
MSKPTLKVESDFTKEFNAIIKKFRHDSVLVGIPEEDDSRKDSDEPIGNAALLAITNFGSTLNNVPPWPVIAIGIRNAQEEIARQFKGAAQETLIAVLRGRLATDILSDYYTRAGIIASVSIKKAINDQEDAPELSERTLAARKAAKFKGTSRGIVTGQMRNAITYVIPGDS